MTTDAAQPDSQTPKKQRNGVRLSAEERVRRQALFLDIFCQTANTTLACRHAGIGRATFYYWLEHNNGHFSERYHQAEVEANELLRAEIYRRAVTGVVESKGVYYMGARVAEEIVRRYSDLLLIFEAKARMPELYRDVVHLEHKGPTLEAIVERAWELRNAEHKEQEPTN